jgi:glycine/D-amino acid oxidase-like deaminating enzyme
MISFWENIFYECDVAIIGAGISGLSTAISLKDHNPDLSVSVFDKDPIPASASSRNAGFACFGSFTELLHDMNHMGETAMLSLVENRWKGLQILEKRLGKDAIDYQNFGGYELLEANQLPLLNEFDAINDILYPLFKTNVFMREDDKIREFGFDDQWCKALIRNPFEGQLHSGKMMRTLTQMAQVKEIGVFRGVDITDFEELNDRIQLETSSGKKISARKLVLCNNAWAGKFFPDEDIRPGRGLVMITSEMDLPFKGAFHFDEGFYYFRDVGRRFLIGGGRNEDFETEQTFEAGINPRIRANLLEKTALILNDRKFEPEIWWSGIMAFGSDKSPVVKKVGENVWLAARLSGMGVALASKIGEDLAQLMTKDA